MKVVLPLILCYLGQALSLANPLPKTSPERNFEAFWQLFQQHYAWLSYVLLQVVATLQEPIKELVLYRLEACTVWSELTRTLALIAIRQT